MFAGPRPVNGFPYTSIKVLSKLCASKLIKHIEATIKLQIGPSSVNKQE